MSTVVSVWFHVELRSRACRGRRRGSVAERPNALALKASVPKQHRGFKSLHFRRRPAGIAVQAVRKGRAGIRGRGLILGSPNLWLWV